MALFIQLPKNTGSIDYVVKHLQPGSIYELKVISPVPGQTHKTLKADENGQITFTSTHNDSATQSFALGPLEKYETR